MPELLLVFSILSVKQDSIKLWEDPISITITYPIIDDKDPKISEQGKLCLGRTKRRSRKQKPSIRVLQYRVSL